MTIKEAFGMLLKAVKKSGLNPFFLINNLKDTFEDVAANVVDNGSIVEVESAQSSGYLVGNVKVNGEDNYLFAPPQIIPPHIYDTNERLVAVFFHDGISENVYERTYLLSEAITIVKDSWAETNIDAPGIKIITGVCYVGVGVFYSGFSIINGKVRILNARANDSMTIDGFTISYIKS